MKVKLSIHEEKLLHTLRFAFTHRDALVCELLQNARRAGASRVVVDYDEALRTLTVCDDGCGIRHFQSLFTPRESHWNSVVQDTEQPYGVGFLSCLYSAKACAIVSLGREIRFNTEDALAGREIEDTHSEESMDITRITLFGVALDGLAQRIEPLVCGFPIPVIFNGVSLPRPFAFDARPTEPSIVGDVYLLGRHTGMAGTTCLLFLQGHLVHGDWAYGHLSNIVHLDPSRFKAWLPDRDRIIDEDQVLAYVDEVLRDLWRGHLREARERMSPDVFVDRYFRAAKTWGLLAELDAVPALPGHLFSRITDYPYQAGFREEAFLTPLQRQVSKSDVEVHSVKLVELDTLCEKNAPLWMYARERQLVCFQDPGLSDAHWVHPFVRHFDEASVQVEVIGEADRTSLHGAFLWREVVLCEAYAIVVGEDRVTLREAGMAWPPGTGILVPEEEVSGQAVEQASDFIDAMNRFHDQELCLDRDALRNLVRLMRARDPSQALESLLADLKLERYPSLRGRSFTLRVGQGTQAPQVALLH